jgi:hypothetical protein
MGIHHKMVLVLLIVVGGVAGFAATAHAAQWDVPDYTTLSIKATTPVVETEAAFRAALTADFDDIDTNGDGSVSLAEAQAANAGLTAAVFNAVDTNGDGLISPAEAGIGGGCACTGIDLSDPAAIIVAVLAFLGLAVGWFCSGC